MKQMPGFFVKSFSMSTRRVKSFYYRYSRLDIPHATTIAPINNIELKAIDWYFMLKLLIVRYIQMIWNVDLSIACSSFFLFFFYTIIINHFKLLFTLSFSLDLTLCKLNLNLIKESTHIHSRKSTIKISFEKSVDFVDMEKLYWFLN